MAGLFQRDYFLLTQDEISKREALDIESRNAVSGHLGVQNPFRKYPKAVRHNLSLFPNNYLDIVELMDSEKLKSQCDGFSNLLDNQRITELDIKRYIQNNGYYHIPASIFSRFNFGHHEAVLFKEFQLGTSYKADYLLAGKASGGWQFIWVEFENPYRDIVIDDGDFGSTIRKGLNQIDDWKTFIGENYSTISAEFRKNTTKILPNEFYAFDLTRMHYVVVAGRRNDFNEKTRRLQRRLLDERKIMLLHYDNILDDARTLIGAQSY